MASETTTPNIGLQVPAFNQSNWQVPINYDLNLLDLIFGGLVQVPALNVVSLTVSDIGPALVPSFVTETPAGTAPSSSYTLSYVPLLMQALYKNGVFLRPSIDYTIIGTAITLNISTVLEDWIYAVYFK
jgi:hypothetical protein